MTYRDNLREPSARKFFDCLVDQMYLGVRYCPMRSSVIPGAFTDDELCTMKNPILLLLGQIDLPESCTIAIEMCFRGGSPCRRT